MITEMNGDKKVRQFGSLKELNKFLDSRSKSAPETSKLKSTGKSIRGMKSGDDFPIRSQGKLKNF